MLLALKDHFPSILLKLPLFFLIGSANRQRNSVMPSYLDLTARQCLWLLAQYLGPGLLAFVSGRIFERCRYPPGYLDVSEPLARGHRFFIDGIVPSFLALLLRAVCIAWWSFPREGAVGCRAYLSVWENFCTHAVLLLLVRPVSRGWLVLLSPVSSTLVETADATRTLFFFFHFDHHSVVTR